MLGGGMRQAGVLAAAGIYALDHHRGRVTEDHAMATRLADSLRTVPGTTVTAVHTNMVFCDFADPDSVTAKLGGADILAAIGPYNARFVTHLDLPEDTPERVVAALS